MAVIPLHIVDAFSEKPFAGNPAAIIPNATILGDDEMMKISEELGMEVGFVLPPEARDADVRLRFFRGRSEAALSGHVLLAAFTSMAERGIFRPTVDGRLLHAETAAGVFEVRLARTSEGDTRITCEMPLPEFSDEVAATEVAAALGADANAVQIDGHGPQRVTCGTAQLLVPVASRDLVRGDLRSLDRMTALMADHDVAGITLFCPETDDPACAFHCRFLRPDIRCYEDVASGTCLAAIGAYVVRHGLMPPCDQVTIATEQGLVLGRPTRAELHVRVLEDQIHRVEVSGTGAVVMRGSFQFQRQAKQALA
jgi:trans-2,3-dihydro-3-hydroxyanthranilate isomerase